MTGRIAVILLTVLSLLVGGLIPVGFMPALSDDGAVLEMVICTATGTKTVYVPAADYEAADTPDAPDGDGDNNDDGQHNVCAYAGTVLAQVAEPTAAALTALPVESRAWFLDHQTTLARLHALPPPSRGPPATEPTPVHIAVLPVPFSAAA